jgi:hypothetical protein
MQVDVDYLKFDQGSVVRYPNNQSLRLRIRNYNLWLK